jgi:peptide deformylase
MRARSRRTATGLDGQSFELEAEELLAVAVQHENDHLDGKLMIDRLGPLRKRVLHRKMLAADCRA